MSSLAISYSVLLAEPGTTSDLPPIVGSMTGTVAPESTIADKTSNLLIFICSSDFCVSGMRRPVVTILLNILALSLDALATSICDLLRRGLWTPVLLRRPTVLHIAADSRSGPSKSDCSKAEPGLGPTPTADSWYGVPHRA